MQAQKARHRMEMDKKQEMMRRMAEQYRLKRVPAQQMAQQMNQAQQQSVVEEYQRRRAASITAMQ